MRSVTSSFLNAAIVAMGLVAAVTVAAQTPAGSSVNCKVAGRGLSVIGLTADQRLICFKDSRPSVSSTIGKITGLANGETTLIGIDFRVQDGNLYGVGNAGGVYRLSTTNAAATRSALTIRPRAIEG